MRRFLFAVSMTFIFSSLALAQFQPSGTVECIAPANPGGGWDFTCRSVGKLLNDLGLVDRPVKVTNMPGGGGGVAFANVVAQRNDDNNLIVAASPATTLRLAQGQYGDFSGEDVRWLGALGADFGVIAVAADSPYMTLDDLIEAWRNDPTSAAVGGGSAVGGQDHMKVLVLAKAAGLDPTSIRYVPFDGGGEALTSLLGGFVQVFPGDASEISGQLEAGNIRILAVLAPERLGGALAEVPTAKELGYDVEWLVFRGFYVPAGMSDEAFAWWSETMATLEASEEWAEARAQNNLGKFFRAGDEFDSFIKAQIQDLRQLSTDLGLIQ